MKLLSYARNGANGIGALREDGTVIDLTARCGCLEVGEALHENVARECVLHQARVGDAIRDVPAEVVTGIEE